MAQYENEQASLKTKVEPPELNLVKEQEKALDATRFLKLVKKYTEIDKLDAEIIREFTERIIVRKKPS